MTTFTTTDRPSTDQTPTNSTRPPIDLPSERVLRSASTDEVPSLTGVPPALVSQAMASLDELAAIPDPARRVRLLDTMGLGRIGDELAAMEAPVGQVTELLDVDGVGPRRFVETITALGQADLTRLDLEMRMADVQAALADVVVDTTAADALFGLILGGREDDVFAEDTPGLGLVKQAVLDSSGRDSLDPDQLRQAIAQLSEFAVVAFAPRVATVLELTPPDGPTTTTDDDFPTAPPSPWTEEFLAGEKTRIVPNCPEVVVSLPQLAPARSELGKLGNRQQVNTSVVKIQRALAGLYLALEAAVIDAIVPDSIPGMPDAIPDTIKLLLRLVVFDSVRELFPKGFLPENPMATSNVATVRQAIGAVDTAVTELAAVQLLPKPAVATGPTLTTSTLDIGGPAGATVVLNGFSRMRSTYTNGVGMGTYSTGGLSDLPWFALVSKPAFTGPEGEIPASVLQLGELGARTDVETEPLTIPAGGQLRLPVKINGNYGQLRVVVDGPGVPVCPRVVADLWEVSGPFEEVVRREATAKHAEVEDNIAALRKLVDRIVKIIDLCQTIVSAVPVLGPVVGIFGDVVEKGVNEGLNALIDRYGKANDAQLAINLAAAESFPESTPPGSREPV